jgi:hypothetical protein
MGFTAFTSRRKAEHGTGRLVVRRVKRLQPRACRPGSGEQSELFAAYRYHAFFTNSAQDTVTADATHRAHAIIEQVIADLKNGPLAHLPSGVFNASAAWLARAAIAFNLTRAAGCLAGTLHPHDGRHTAGPTDHRPSPAGALRPTPRAAPTSELALADRLDRAVHRRDRTTSPRLLTPGHTAPTDLVSGRAGQTGKISTPPSTARSKKPSPVSSPPHRCIRAQKSPALRRRSRSTPTSVPTRLAGTPGSAKTPALRSAVASSAVDRPREVSVTRMARPSCGWGSRRTRPSCSRRTTALVTLVGCTCSRLPTVFMGSAPRRLNSSSISTS